MNYRLNTLPFRNQHLGHLLFSAICLGTAAMVSLLCHTFNPENSDIILFLFLLISMIVLRYTPGYRYGILCWLFLMGALRFGFIPSSAFPDPAALAVMFLIIIFTGTITAAVQTQENIIKEREKQLSEIEIERLRANLLRAISHDLRIPLTSIIGNSSLFLEDETYLSDAEKQDLIRTIQEDSNWLLNMVENLLTVTRIRDDSLSIVTSNEPVEEVIAEVLQKIEKSYPDAEIRVNMPRDLILLPMDAILIQQVIINLISNAIIHSGCSGPIDLIIRSTPHAVSFTIRDYGRGISLVSQQNLFSGAPCQSSPAADTGTGMGIGLSICKTIIAAHNGTIIGRSRSTGTDFIFTLPKV